MCSKLSVTSHSAPLSPVTWTRDRTYSGDRLAYSARAGCGCAKPGRDGDARAGSALVALKAEHAHAPRVAQSSGATGRSRPAE
jgi:hypothetical protein